MNSPRYSMSFTTGALLYRESLVIVELYAQRADWKAVRDQVVAGNLLQMRTANASVRVCREVVSRLRLLTVAELDLLAGGLPGDQRYLLWLALCKRYRFIYDFAVEVIYEKFLRLDLQLDPAEYDRYFDRKAEWHPEVELVAPRTRKTQRRMLLQAMREAGMIDADLRIIPALLSPDLIAAVAGDDPQHFALFPISQRDIQQWMT